MRGKMRNSHYHELQARIFKALGHPSRLRIVESLLDSARSVCEIREIIGTDISTVSNHLNILKEAGILQNERRGTTVLYSLHMKCVVSWLISSGSFVGQRLEEQIAAVSRSRDSQ